MQIELIGLCNQTYAKRGDMEITTIILAVLLPVTGILGYVVRAYLGKIKLNSAEAKSHRIIQDALKEAENKNYKQLKKDFFRKRKI